jgi:hypothetical protein
MNCNSFHKADDIPQVQVNSSDETPIYAVIKLPEGRANDLAIFFETLDQVYDFAQKVLAGVAERKCNQYRFLPKLLRSQMNWSLMPLHLPEFSLHRSPMNIFDWLHKRFGTARPKREKAVCTQCGKLITLKAHGGFFKHKCNPIGECNA